MKKVLIFFAAVSGIFMQPLFSQIPQNHNEMGGGAFTIGYGFMDVSPLRAFIPEGLPAFGNQQLILGGVGFANSGNFVIGGSGIAIMGDKLKSDSLIYEPNGGFGTIDLGYLLVHRNNFQMGPLVGLGGGGFGLHITQNKNLTATEVAADPGREINISAGGFVFDGSLFIHFIPVLNYNTGSDSYQGFMTGIQIGYTYSLPNSDWVFHGGDITNGPEFGYNMFYVRLLIGGFWCSNVK